MPPTKKVLGGSLDNDFQWRNLYLKRYGCCTYAPPLPVNSEITGYAPPKRRDIFTGSDSDEDGDDSVSLLSMESPNEESSKRELADSVFALQLSLREEEAAAQADGAMHGWRRAAHKKKSTVLRRDDFFDRNDVFSNTFFSFLWDKNDKSHRATITGPADEDDDSYESGAAGKRLPPPGPGASTTSAALMQSMAGLSKFGTEGFASMYASGTSASAAAAYLAKDEVPAAVRQLQEETWAMIMDGRLLGWLSREAREQSVGAAKLRHRLLDVALRGPSSSLAAAWAAEKGQADSDIPAVSAYGDEDALQQTLDMFAPFTAVISSPIVIRNLESQFFAAKRAQLRGLPGNLADLSGLPLLSQYKTWRETYENRTNWEKAPFSYFFIHDVTYNFSQVISVFVLLQRICLSGHTHSHHCVECKKQAMALEDAGGAMANGKAYGRSGESQRPMCPLYALRELTEDILLSYEQSSSSDTLTMTSRVLEFLTDCALDAKTADHFVGPQALKRQFASIIPDVPIGSLSGAVRLMKRQEMEVKTARADKAEETAGNAEGGGAGEGRPVGDDANAADSNAGSTTDAPLFRPLPRSFSEKDLLSLFEMSYWFVDAATANAQEPIDSELVPPPRVYVSEMPYKDAFLLGAGDGKMTSDMSMLKSERHQSFDTSRQSWSSANGRRPFTSNSKMIGSFSALGTEDMPLKEMRHQYLPGRRQLHDATESLVDVMAQIDAYRKQRDIQYPVAGGLTGVDPQGSLAASSRHSGTGADPAAMSGGKLPPRLASLPYSIGDHVNSMDVPLLLLNSYIRLHGGGWMQHVCRHLFNILRKESVLLYVNKLDLDGCWDVLQRGLMDGADGERVEGGPVSVPPSAAATAKGSSKKAKKDPGGAMGRATAKRTPPKDGPLTVLSKKSEDSAEAAGSATEADCQEFLNNLSGLEDLISQDIAYCLNEFFSLLYGKRSATRLPQGITTLLTQYTATVHMHVLKELGLAEEARDENEEANVPGYTAQKVSESIRVWKHRQAVIGRRNQQAQGSSQGANRGSLGSGSSLSHLFLTIEQQRLTKFILFDSWIIPALNNAVLSGYLAADSPMHLRWNINAFARYLKVLVNAPFAEYDRSHFPSLAGPPVSALPRGSRATALRGRRAKAMAAAQRFRTLAAEPRTVTIPSYITGIYDVHTGSLVRVNALSMVLGGGNGAAEPGGLGDDSFSFEMKETDTNASRPATPQCDEAAFSTNDAHDWTGLLGKSPSMSMSVRKRKKGKKKQQLSQRARPSLRNKKGSASTIGAGRSLIPGSAGTTHSVARAPSPFIVMDNATWLEVSPSLQVLNESLGIKGYEVGDDENEERPTMMQMAQSRGGRKASSKTDGLSAGYEMCAMRALNAFCARSAGEVGPNVVIPEFDVLPSMVARCIERVHEFVTGAHPLTGSGSHARTAAKTILPSKHGIGLHRSSGSSDICSLYIACLNGVLLHPRTAARVIDNVHRNSPPIYHALMQPVNEDTALRLHTALLGGEGELPLVDCNAVLPYVFGKSVESDAAPSSLSRKWENASRKLFQHAHYLSTGAQVSSTSASVASPAGKYGRSGPVNSLRALKTARDHIQREMGVTPLAFDIWWRSMAASLCVRATVMFSECSRIRSDAFLQFCRSKREETQWENTQDTTNFVETAGAHASLVAAVMEESNKKTAISELRPRKRNVGKGSGAARGTAGKGTAVSTTKSSARSNKKVGASSK